MAGRIPQSFINDLIERVDIVEVIETRIALKRAGKNHQALCPFHNEKTPSFSVSSEKGFYHCFGCGAHGTAIGFLMEHDRLEFPEAVETLAGIAGVEVPREATAFKGPDRSLYDVLRVADRFYRKALRHHAQAPRVVEYLKNRGLTGVVARDFGIGFAPPGWDNLKIAFEGQEDKLVEAGMLIRGDTGRVYDRFRDRVIFPIRDTRGRVVGFGGRVLGDDQPKYLNSPETPVFHKGRELYGLFEARLALRPLDVLVVVEGYMDVVALAQHGVANAVATLGTATGEAHFEKLYRYVPEVVCCFDGDAAGRQAAWKALANALPTMKEGRQLKFIFLPDGEDPDTLIRSEGKERFVELMRQAVPAGDYFLTHIAEGLDLSSMDARARLCELALPYLQKLPDGLYRRMLVERLSQRADVSPQALESRLGPSGPVARSQPTQNIRQAPVTEEPAMGKRLLASLVQAPGLLFELDEVVRIELLGTVDTASLFVRVARYLGNESEPDTATLLGRFAGDVAYPELLALAQAPLTLTGDALVKEFSDGVARYLDARGKADIRALVRDLQEDGSVEKLARYWEAKVETHETPH